MVEGGMRLLASVVAATLVVAVSPALAGPSETGGAGSSGRPDVELPLEGAIINPDWVQKPTGDEFALYYPPIAQMLGLGGRSQVTCEVATSGALENCVVTVETPAGMGFGAAALSMAQYFRMRPKSVDGVSVAGAKVTVPIRFRLPLEPDETGTPSQGSSPQPSARALQLATRLAQLGYGPDKIQAYKQAMQDSINARFANVTLTEQQQTALQAYVAAVDITGSLRIEAIANRYAARFSEQQLAELDRFFETPVGRAWLSPDTSDAGRDRQLAVQLKTALETEARRQYCSKFQCLEDPPAVPQSSPTASAK